MHWRVQLVIVLLVVGAVGMGYIYATKDERVANQEAASISLEEAALEEEEADATQEIPLAQLFAVSLSLDSADAATASAMRVFIEQFNPGYVVLFGSAIATQSAQTAITELTENEAVAPKVFVDHEGGLVQRLTGSGFTRIPSWRRVCQMSVDARKDLFAQSAAELRAVGIDGVLAPVVDVAASNLVMRERTCSGDPDLVASVASEYVAAFEEVGIASVIKHYPGLGTVNKDPHTSAASVTVRPEDVAPFYALLDRWPELAVMTTHVGVSNQQAQVPCSLSASCVKQIFELYPQAFTMTDALEMEGARYNAASATQPRSLSTVALQALRAGNHALLFGPGVSPTELWEVMEAIRAEYVGSFEFRDTVDAALAKGEQYRAQWETTP